MRRADRVRDRERGLRVPGRTAAGEQHSAQSSGSGDRGHPFMILDGRMTVRRGRCRHGSRDRHRRDSRRRGPRRASPMTRGAGTPARNCRRKRHRPNRPPTRRACRRLRRKASASAAAGSLRAKDGEHPDPEKGRDQRGATGADQRQRNAGDRHQTDDRGHVDDRLHDQPGRHRRGSQPDERVRRPGRDPDPGVREDSNSATTISVPIRPSSSPMIARMKSVCAFGR